MELTRIGTENEESFAPLLMGLKSEDYLMAVGAIEDGEAAGVALYNELGGAMMLEYIYVSSKFRRKGIGTALINDFFHEIRELYPLTLHVNFPDRSEELLGFFTSLGFHIFRDGASWRVPASAFLHSAAFTKMISGRQVHRVLRVSELTEAEMDALCEAMDGEDLDPNSVKDRSLSETLSIVTLDEATGKPVACLLCEQSGDQIVLRFLVNFSRDANNLIDLFRAFSGAVEEASFMDSDLLFVTMNDKMLELARKLVTSEEELKQEGFVISASYTFV